MRRVGNSSARARDRRDDGGGAVRALPVPLALLLSLLMTGGVDRKAAQLNNQANEQYQAANMDEANQLYDEAQSRAPDSPEIAYNRGNALYRQGKLDDAVRQLMHGTQSTDPDLQRRSYYNLGNALHDLKKLPEAAVAYRHALAIDPEDRDAKINYEKTLVELEQQKKQPQDSKSRSDKNKQQQQKDGQGDQQQGQQKPDEQQQAQNQNEQQQQQNGQQGQDQEGQEQQAQAGDSSQDQKGDEDQRQAAAVDSVAAGDLSREEAVRILAAMREQERELQRERARKPVRSRKVEKDW
jgi:Ca-activated chloride channel family protein